MRPTRRQFLKASAAAGALASVGGFSSRWLVPPAHAASDADEAIRALMLRGSDFASERAEDRLKILVLGGTAFLGPAVVHLALARGHRVELYNRGRTNPHLFEDLKQYHGDRRNTHEPIAGRGYDVVLDTSGYVPRVVRDAAETVRDEVDRYFFISTISVYASFEQRHMDEDAPLVRLEDPSVEEVNGETYGGLKALCEQAVEEAMPGRVCTIRPGLIVGPMDRTDRFTYWPVRVSRGGEVLAPGEPTQAIAFIDVRDLAEFIVRCMEDGVTGVYNATSDPGRFTTGQLLETCKRVSGSDARFTWVPADFLEAQEVAPWSEMPVWLPAQGEYAGFGTVEVRRAMAKGLHFRPLEKTVSDTLDWWRTQPESAEGPRSALRAGIAPDKEQKVLAAWHARSTAPDPEPAADSARGR